MQSPIGESLAEFGRRYRTLFIIGEFECSGTSRAERLHGKGRLLLGDFVSGFYAILKATNSTVAIIQELDIRVQKDLRITSQDKDTQRLCEAIQEELLLAFTYLKTAGEQNIKELQQRMMKYRDKDVTSEFRKLKIRVDELGFKELEGQSQSSRGHKGRIVSMANSLKLFIGFSAEKTLEAPKGLPLEIAKTDLQTAQELLKMASKTGNTFTQCSLDWSDLSRAIETRHTSTIIEHLSNPTITQQLKAEIKREFDLLRDALASSIQQMNNVYKDIDTQFGHGRGISARVDEFQRAMAQVSSILKELLSAKKVVDKSQQDTYLKEIYNLARISLDQLRMVERVFEEWIIYIRSQSTAPLPFIDDAFQLNTDTAESFEHRWVRSHTCLDNILSTSKKRTQKKSDSEVLPITSSSEALRTMKDLEQTLFAITGFSVRLPMDLLAYDRRPEDMPRVDSGLAVDPFAIAEQTVIKAYEVLKDEITRLELFLDPTSDTHL